MVILLMNVREIKKKRRMGREVSPRKTHKNHELREQKDIEIENIYI